MAHNWIEEKAQERLAEILGPFRYSPRVARRRTAVTQAAAKVAALNEGERPSTLDPLQTRLNLARETGKPAIDAADVRAILSDLKARLIDADIDAVIECLEDYGGDPEKALGVLIEQAAGYYKETQIHY